MSPIPPAKSATPQTSPGIAFARLVRRRASDVDRGGAALGGRIRMQEPAIDPGGFSRSMATRGRFGGLSRATPDAVDLMDAAGRDPILIETVGVGQDEIDVVRVADTVVVEAKIPGGIVLITEAVGRRAATKADPPSIGGVN